jgi:hypothetical protein
MAINYVHSIEEFIKTVKDWGLAFPQARMNVRGSAVPQKRGNTFIMRPLTEVIITAARRNEDAEGGYEIVRFSFDYIVGERQCRVHTGNAPELRPLPMDDPPGVYRDRLQLEGFLVEKGEWSEASAQESLNLMPA